MVSKACCLEDLPVEVQHQLDWGLDDLADAVRADAFPIVGIDLRPVDGIFAFHAVVVVNISTRQVVVHDPLHDEGPRSIGISAFEAAWSAADREAVIIRPRPTG